MSQKKTRPPSPSWQARKERPERKAQARALAQDIHLEAQEFVRGLEYYRSHDHAPWILHGLNFLTSDYDQGIWSPLYPEIYVQGAEPSKADLDKALNRAIDRYCDKEGHWQDEWAHIGAWLAQEPGGAYVYFKAAQQALGGSPEPIQGDPALWAWFEEVRNG